MDQEPIDDRDNFWPTFKIQGTVESVVPISGSEPALPEEQVTSLRITLLCGSFDPFPVYISSSGEHVELYDRARQSVRSGMYLKGHGIIPRLDGHYLFDFDLTEGTHTQDVV